MTFLSGFVSSGFSVGGKQGAIGAIKMAIVGGKFANGAMGSTFQYLFNDTLVGAQKTLKNWKSDKKVVQETKDSIYIKQLNADDSNSYVVTDGKSYYTPYPEAPKDLDLAVGLGSSLLAGFGTVRVGSYLYTHPLEMMTAISVKEAIALYLKDYNPWAIK